MGNTVLSMNEHALKMIVNALRDNDSSMLSSLGLGNINEELARQIKNLKMFDLSCANDFRSPICEFKVDVRMLEMYITYTGSKSHEEDLINEAIRGGIRQPQLEIIKGVGRREYSDRRKRLGLTEHHKGRIEQLSIEDEEVVYRAWMKLTTDVPDLLERYVELHRQTGLPIDKAWITINQRGEDI